MAEQLGIGFAGPGWIGSVQLRKLAARKDVRIAALYSPRAERALALLDELKLSRDLYVPVYDEMVATPEVNALWVASPNAYHGAQSIAALNARKHVFCEKPCATSLAEHRLQQALAVERAELVTFVDYVLYFDPLEQRLRQMVSSGLFGDLTQVQINYRHPVNITGGRAWKLNKDIMGDAIGMGINHALSVMHWIFEANGQHPVSVFAFADKARVRPFEAEPIWSILVRYSGGATGFCFGNIDSGNGYDAYHNLFGTEGAFVFDPGQDQPRKVRYWSRQHAQGQWIWPLDSVACSPENLESYAWSPNTANPDSGDVLNHSLNEAIDHFLACVRNRKQSALSFCNTAAIVDVGWAAQISAKTGAQVLLPLDPVLADRYLRDPST
jgi:predicted dehydrogenase